MKASLSFVRERFRRFNSECFADTLPEVPIRIGTSSRSAGALKFRVVTQGSKKRYSDFSLWISGNFDLPERELEDIIIHEMIHLYIHHHDLTDTSAHGRVFRTMMSEINRRHGRAITVSRRNPEGNSDDVSKKAHYICVTTFRDGKRLLTVCSRTRIFDMHRELGRLTPIQVLDWEWYYTSDPYFNRFPHARTMKFYAISEETKRHISSSQPCVCDGTAFRPAIRR